MIRFLYPCCSNPSVINQNPPNNRPNSYRIAPNSIPHVSLPVIPPAEIPTIGQPIVRIPSETDLSQIRLESKSRSSSSSDDEAQIRIIPRGLIDRRFFENFKTLNKENKQLTVDDLCRSFDKTNLKQFIHFLLDDHTVLPELKKNIMHRIFKKNDAHQRYYLVNTLLDDPQLTTKLLECQIQLPSEVRNHIKSNKESYTPMSLSYRNFCRNEFKTLTTLTEIEIKKLMLHDEETLHDIAQQLYANIANIHAHADKTDDTQTEILNRKISGYCGLTTIQLDSVIDILYEKVKHLSEENGNEYHRYIERNCDFTHNLRAEETSSLLQQLKGRNRALTRTSATQLTTTLAALGIEHDEDHYQTLITDFNMASYVRPLFEKFNEHLKKQTKAYGSNNKQETIRYILNYLELYQEISNSLQALQNSKNPTEDIEPIAQTIMDHLLTYGRIGFPDGWPGHSISTQIEITDASSPDKKNIQLRVFNAGDDSNHQPRVKNRKASIRDNLKVRTVIEFKRDDMPLDQVKELLITMSWNAALDVRARDNRGLEEKTTLFTQTFGCRQIDPNIDPSELGDFEALGQQNGICLIRSLLEQTRGLMVLQLGPEEGEGLYKNFETFLRKDIALTLHKRDSARFSARTLIPFNGGNYDESRPAESAGS